MRTALFRFAISIAFVLVFVAPRVASADALTADQLTSLNNGTKAYFRAVLALDYAAISGMTAPGFQIVDKAGKPIGQKLAGQIQTTKSTMVGGMGGGIEVISATSDGNTVIENVSVHASGQSSSDSGNQGSGRINFKQQHVLTWQKSPSGKWLLAKDQMLEASSTKV